MGDQVAYGQSLGDVGLRIQLAAWIGRLCSLADELSGERDVGCNDQIAGGSQFDDAPIGHIRAPRDDRHSRCCRHVPTEPYRAFAAFAISGSAA